MSKFLEAIYLNLFTTCHEILCFSTTFHMYISNYHPHIASNVENVITIIVKIYCSEDIEINLNETKT